MFFRVLRALRHLPYRPLSAVAVLWAVAWLSGHVERWSTFTYRSHVAAVALAVTVLGHWVLKWLAPALSTGRWVDRRDDASEHAKGVATWTDIGEIASKRAMRTKVTKLRPAATQTPPGVRALPQRAVARMTRRWTVPVISYAVPLVRPSWAPVTNTVWASCEEVTLRIGGPRSGKSGSLACHAADAPGALLVTTSRTDLLDLTADAREQVGRVEVFNPTGLGDLVSTVRWTPLVGCDDYGTAMRRARDLIPAGASAEGERWDEQARSLLATLMHAANLSDGTMRTVLGWISPADVVARDEILGALTAPRGTADGGADVRAMVHQIRSLYGVNDRTLSSVTATLLPHLRWINDRTVAAVGDARLDDPALLDVAGFVAGGCDSLYLIGRDGGTHTLIGALTAEVAHQVRMTATRSLGRRLDPPMTAVLDEAPLTCGPIPLHEWTSDMGGFNLTIHIGAQSLAQLREVWGRERAAAIMANTGSLLVFGGIKSADDLQELSTLCGTRLVALDADDNRPLPVMTPSEISVIPPGKALVLKNGMRPIIGDAPMIWHRRPSWVAAALRWILAVIGRGITATAAAVAAGGRTTLAGARGLAAQRAARAAELEAALTAVTPEPVEPAGPGDDDLITASPDSAEGRLLAELEELFARPGLDLDDPTQVNARPDEPGRDEPGRGTATGTADGDPATDEGGAA